MEEQKTYRVSEKHIHEMKRRHSIIQMSLLGDVLVVVLLKLFGIMFTNVSMIILLGVCALLAIPIEIGLARVWRTMEIIFRAQSLVLTDEYMIISLGDSSERIFFKDIVGFVVNEKVSGETAYLNVRSGGKTRSITNYDDMKEISSFIQARIPANLIYKI